MTNLFTPDVAGFVHLLGVIPAFVLVSWVWEDRRNPGVKWFIGAMLAGGLWSVLFGLMVAVDSVFFTLALHNLYLFSMHVAAACWFLLAYEWSYQSTLSNRAFGALLIVPLLLQVLSIVRPSLMFVRTVDAEGVLHVSYGIAFLLGQLVYGYLPIVVGASFWVGETIAWSGTRRRQALAFLVATAILFFATVVDLAGQSNSFLMDVDLIMVGLYASGILIAYSISRNSLLQVGMAARKTIIEEMDDVLLLLNADRQIVDVNHAARQLFGFTTDPVGKPVENVMAEYPTFLESLSRGGDETTTLTVDGNERHFALSMSPIAYGRGLKRKAILLRDITILKERERDLDRLSNMLSRVFRHNVRNDLIPIREYAELIRQRSDGDVSEFAERILAKSNQLFAQTEKAQSIEHIIKTRETMPFALAETVERAVSPYRTNDPDVRIEIDIPPEVVVDAHPELPEAIGELVENAVEHSRETVRCELGGCFEDDTALLWVEDDGPGIPMDELDVLHNGIETEMLHGGGVGLWVVRWIIDRSGGSVHSEVTEEGTRIGIELKRSDEDVPVRGHASG